MNVSSILLNLKHLASNNSTTILTATAVAGVVSTAVAASKATLSASEHIANETTTLFGEEFSTKEKIQMGWKFYIPTVAIGSTTIACIIGAHTINTNRNAALVTAYSLTETAFNEYKNKVVEQIGVGKELKVRDAIAADRVNTTPLSSREVIITGNGEVLCFETMTGRYFKSDMETIRKAQNDINAQIINEMYATQNDFCTAIGLAPTKYGDEIGWNTANLLDLEFSSVISDDGKPCLTVSYAISPVRDYGNLH